MPSRNICVCIEFVATQIYLFLGIIYYCYGTHLSAGHALWVTRVYFCLDTSIGLPYRLYWAAKLRYWIQELSKVFFAD